MIEIGLEPLWQSMGIAHLEWGQALMMGVGGLLIYLAVEQRRGEGAPQLAGPDFRQDPQFPDGVVHISPAGVEGADQLDGHDDGRHKECHRSTSEIEFRVGQHPGFLVV